MDVWVIVYYVDERDDERCKHETGVVDSLQSRFNIHVGILLLVTLTIFVPEIH